MTIVVKFRESCINLFELWLLISHLFLFFMNIFINQLALIYSEPYTNEKILKSKLMILFILITHLLH